MADSVFDATKMPLNADPAAVLPRTTARPSPLSIGLEFISASAIK
jgi:hypothetical protein